MTRHLTVLTATVALATVALAMAACGSGDATTTTEPTSGDPGIPPLDTLTETYGCGFGFWIGNPEQTFALRIQYTGDGTPERNVELPDSRWDVRILEGRDLYANWCDDVMEPDEPVPVEERSMPVTAGTLELVGEIPEPFEGGSLTVEATGLRAALPGGDGVDLGDITITNDSYGFLAG